MPIETLNDETLGEWSSRVNETYRTDLPTFSLNGKPMTETKAGLLIVAELPKPIEPKPPAHPATEIQNEDDRKRALAAFDELWRAFGLMNRGGGIVLPNDVQERKELHRTLLRTISKITLGEEYCGLEYT